MGIKTAAVISCMESPLGNAVGNALEVAESVLTLQGRGPKDLVDIVQQTGLIYIKFDVKYCMTLLMSFTYYFIFE